MRKKFILVDGFGLIFRAFYAFIRSPLKNSKGEPTSAIYGFCRMLFRVLKDHNPDYLVIAWESKEETKRHKMYPDYKANRDEPPDDLRIQIPRIIDLMEKFGFKGISVEGYEADDIIASFASHYKEKEELDVLILSGDKDLMQLFGENIKGLVPQKGISDILLYSPDEVKEKIGVLPEQITDYIGLVGDSSDNIPGVKGVGQKTAVSLLKDYKSIEELYDHLDQISSKSVQKKLKENKENAFLSKKLAKLYKDIDLEYNLNKYQFNQVDIHSSLPLLKQWEMQSLLDEFLSKKEKQQVQGELFASMDESKEEDKDIIKERSEDYHILDSMKDIRDLLKKLKKSKEISIDLESTSEFPMLAQMVGVALSDKEGTGYYIPIKHPEIDDYKPEEVLKLLKDWIEAYKNPLIGQNLKYDYIIFKRYGINIARPSFDTMIASYVIDPARQSHSLDTLASYYFNHKTIKFNDIISKGQTVLDVPLKDLGVYACEDADIAYRLYNKMQKELEQYNLKQIYYDVDLPLVEVLVDMEVTGVKINKEYFHKMSGELDQMMQNLEKNIWKEAGVGEFNINSPKQLQRVLFEDLKLPVQRKTKTGYSTDEGVLEFLSKKHPVPRMILEYRQVAKLKNAYLDSIPKLINEETGRVHTSFNQTITTTGRLSSNNPNLQNIPIKGDIGSKIRNGFVGEGDNLILSADYSQIELRILAHLSEDEKLLKAYQENKDLHKQTAAIIYNIKEEEVTKEQRNDGKIINFSIVYGAGARRISDQVGVSNKEASQFIDNYFKEYKGVERYIDQQKRKAYKEGKVYTMFGRVRHLPQMQDKNAGIRAQGERLAINTPIQGTSADIIKLAMVKIFHRLKKEKLQSKMIITVHDELIFEVTPNEKEIMEKLVKEEMENIVSLKVPLTVSTGIGESWADAH